MSNVEALREAITGRPPVPPVSSLAIASLTLGVLTVGPALFALLLRSGGALAVLLYLAVVGIPAVLAIVFGHLGVSVTNRGERRGRGLAVWGITLGYIAVAVPFVAAIIETLAQR